MIAEIDESLEKLDSDTANLNSLEYHEDNVLVFMNDIIDDLCADVSRCNPTPNRATALGSRT